MNREKLCACERIESHRSGGGQWEGLAESFRWERWTDRSTIYEMSTVKVDDIFKVIVVIAIVLIRSDNDADD